MSRMLQAMMPDAWRLFFHHRNLRDIQAKAMPHILQGDSVLICSPTASGKTETAVAPLYQRHLSFNRKKLSTVYVAPTKALVNDLYYRLCDYFMAEGDTKRVLRYTGDHHDILHWESAFILIATPEALDSAQLTRPEMFRDVRAIVFDEIHFLHGNCRGEQLRYVANRIRGNAVSPASPKDYFHVVAMSASLNDVESIKRTWCGEHAVTIENHDRRSIEMVLLQVSNERLDQTAEDVAKSIFEWVKTSGNTRVLLFANSRNEAHILAVALSRVVANTKWSVFLHIGILSAGERDRIENDLKTCRAYLCVATSTLEIGIDIGTIEVIVLLSPPGSVISFLQRVGRGNRRSDACKVVAVFRNDYEMTLYRCLLALAENGSMDELYEYNRPSVQFQQVLSLAWWGVRNGNPLTAENIVDRTGGYSHSEVLQDMISQGLVYERKGALIPSDDLMDEGDRRNIHTVIGKGVSRQVIDAETGRHVATVGSDISHGLVYLDGNIKEISVTGGQYAYLEGKRTTGPGLIGKLPSTRNKMGLGWKVCWELALFLDTDPKKWIIVSRYLKTWGGRVNNEILSRLCKLHGLRAQLKVDDFGLEGMPADFLISPKIVLEWIAGMDPSRIFTFSDANWFREPTAYFSKMGLVLRKKEAFNSIPMKIFSDWLSECLK